MLCSVVNHRFLEASVSTSKVLDPEDLQSVGQTRCVDGEWELMARLVYLRVCIPRDPETTQNVGCQKKNGFFIENPGFVFMAYVQYFVNSLYLPET